MARPVRKRDQRRKGSREAVIALSRENFIIMGIGLLVILLGYAAMLDGRVEGFLPLVVAPILLVLGYCVIIPLGILYKKSYITGRADEKTQPAQNSKH